MFEPSEYADRFISETPSVPQASWMSGAEASFAESWEYGPSSSLARSVELAAAEYSTGKYGRFTGPMEAQVKRTPIPNWMAKGMAKDAGVTVDFGDDAGQTTQEAATIMVERAVERKKRSEVIQSSQIGVAPQIAIGLASGLADPLAVISGFTPIAPARLVAGIEGATSVLGRAGYRAAAGLAEGTAGAVALEPLTAFAATQEGRDYGVLESLQNVAMGAAFGTVFRPVVGGVADIWHSRTAGNAIPDVADIVARAPPEIHDAAIRQAASDLVNERPVDAGSVIERAAAEHPDLAKRLLVSASLRRDGPEIDDVVARQEWWQERLTAAATERRRATKSDEAAYTKRMFDEAGVKPRTKHANAARMIAAYEREVLGAERTRVPSVRVDDPAPGAEPVAVGDIVETSDGEQFTFAGGKGAKVTNVYDDPVYGKRVTVEGSSSAIELNRVKVKAKAAPEGEKPAVAKAGEAPDPKIAALEGEKVVSISEKRPQTYYDWDDKNPAGFGSDPRVAALEAGPVEAPAPQYHLGQVTSAIRKQLKDKKGKATKEDIMAALPGIDEKQFDAMAKDITSQELSGLAMQKKGKQTTFTGKKMTPDQRHRAMLEDYRGKVTAIRRVLDVLFPSMAAKKTYYLHSIFDHADKYNLGPENTRVFLNDEIAAGRLKAVDEETGKPINNISTLHFDIDTRGDQPGVLLTFSTMTPERPLTKMATLAELKSKTSKPLGPLSPEENAKITADMKALGTKADPIARTPAKEPGLSPEHAAELESERAAINEMLSRETAEIDTYYACLLGEIE